MVKSITEEIREALLPRFERVSGKKLRFCEYCGCEYESLNPSRFCSNRCRQANKNNKDKPLAERVCRKCGKGFMTLDYREQFCSTRCRRFYQRKYDRLRMRNKRAGIREGSSQKAVENATDQTGID